MFVYHRKNCMQQSCNNLSIYRHWVSWSAAPFVSSDPPGNAHYAAFRQSCLQRAAQRVHPGKSHVSINSLIPEKFAWNFRQVIFKQILVIDGSGISCENALIWMSLDSTDDQSTFVQVMAWCRQVASHYLRQCWPRSLSSYCVTIPQWVNSLTPWGFEWNFR